MTHEEMTVHKALAELKILDDRIQKAIDAHPFVAVKKHGTDNMGGVSAEDFKAQARAAWDKATALIARRNAIKRAVVLSNATTRVRVAGAEYTVAEAIDMKNHGLDGKNALLATMGLQWSRASAAAENANKNLDARADEYTKAMFGATDMTKAGAEAAKARADFVTLQTAELVDPLNLRERMSELEEEVNAFAADVDAALSVSNAVTTITVEY